MRSLVFLAFTIVGCATEEVPLGTTTTDSGTLDSTHPDTRIEDTARDTIVDTFMPLDAAAVKAAINEEFFFLSCLPPPPADPVRLTLTCDTTVRIEIDLVGAAATITARSADLLVECAM